MEQEFYDTEAKKFLANFDEALFRYDENEPMPASHRFFYSLFSEIRNRRILDIGCGHGFTSVRLAKQGADVYGIDISPKMIELARRNAAFNHVSDKVTFQVMSAQEMDFDSDFFDWVIGLGVLHHLNLELGGKEIFRVLKKGGKALFIEPRIPFKELIFLRSLFPVKCLESPGGSQLTDKEIRELGKRFSLTQINYFLFLRKLSRLPFLGKYAETLEKIDQKMIERMPFLYKFYWAFVVQFTK
ncbi:MAG: class I SAM-dependent methyltransferase [Calditrichaeota bacterium]|nr:class I SAM-dependent methyltransferase [Calditrichota bacterium]